MAKETATKKEDHRRQVWRGKEKQEMDTKKTKQPSLAAFMEEAIARTKERYTGCDVKVVDVENNGICQTGLIIQPKDSNGEISLFRTVYLNELYREYLGGTPMDVIADRIAAHHEATKGQGAFLVPDFLHFDEMEYHICYRLVNAALNKDYLEKIPHRLFLDLAVIYCVPVTGENGIRGVVAVTNEHVERWQIDEERLYACAELNTVSMYPAELRKVRDVIREVIPDCNEPDVNSGLHILINRVGSGGAGAMLCKSLLRRFASEYRDFYIIPSSICEVLLLPVSYAPEYVTKESLPGIVRDVNEKHVAPEAVLSNNAYLYHADTDEIEILT